MSEKIEITLTQSQLTFKKPVDTPFGKLRFLTFDEYMDFQDDLTWIAQNVLHLYYMFLKTIPEHDKESRKKFKEFKEHSLREIVLTHEAILYSYQQVLLLMLDENDFSNDPQSLNNILVDIFSHDETFLLIREYIMKMNLLKEDKVSPNAKIQQLLERDREVNNRININKTPTLSDIAFSVSGLTPHSIEEVRQMSPIQVHSLYARISADKDYERNVLFATVSNEVEIESWAKKIDLFEVKDTAISKSAFDQKNAGMFK